MSSRSSLACICLAKSAVAWKILGVVTEDGFEVFN